MKRFAIGVPVLICLAAAMCVALSVEGTKSGFAGAPPAAEGAILIENARIFDGTRAELADGMSVLVRGNRIERIAASIDPPADATVLDAGGRVMTPGFIDCHAHLMFQMSFGEAATSDQYYYGYVATRSAETLLMSGFTTVRDVGGNSFSLKKAIDRGVVVGPRVYPSGPMISQTSGHSDHRTDADGARHLFNDPSVYMKYGHVAIADGRPEVLVVVREALRRGASQIKICVGGGTGSFADPLDVKQFTVIAAVRGFAFGGGTEISLMCDIIIADATAQFALPEVTLGVIPGAGGPARLTRAVGKAKAMYYVLTGKSLGAEEAERIGMITKAVEDGKHMEEAMEVASAIARNPRLAVLAGKESVNQQAETPLIAGLKLERRLFHGLFSTPDQKEGMAAFAEKRSPNFKKY